MAEQPDDKLEEQAERIRRLGEGAGLRPKLSSAGNDFRGAGKGYRAATEFLSSLLTGVGLGWVVDQAFDTAPWGLLGLVLVGFGAGLFNLWRAFYKSADATDEGAQKD